MIEVYYNLEYIHNRELKAKVKNKLMQFLGYILDIISELENTNEEWIYEEIFPKLLFKEKKELCKNAVETLADWIDDEYIHKLKHIHEYALFGIIQYCKEADKEYFDAVGSSLFDMKYDHQNKSEDEKLEDVEYNINTFDFYENDFFQDYDFLNIATYFELYKNHSVLLKRLGINLEDYKRLMPVDIEEEYIKNKKVYELEEMSFITKDNIRGINNMKNPRVFISYSWDSENHKEWVKQLWKTLRDNGVDATIDEVETQYGTINLNHMMVENIRNSDYIIVVLTEEYAKKANNLKGGVGRETNFLYNYLMENTSKIIPIVRSGGQSSIPFYLQGLHYIDFSNDSNLEERFKELIRRVSNQPKIEVPQLGEIPKLEVEKVQAFDFSINNNKNIGVYEELIPNLCNIIEPTELDKNRFIKESYVQLKEKLADILNLTRERNHGFDYEIDELINLKSIIRVYFNGMNKYNLKIWVSTGFGGRDLSINMYYGNYISDSDNSMNEMIRCNVSKNNELFLNMMMNHSNMNKDMTVDDVLKVIWKGVLASLK